MQIYQLNLKYLQNQYSYNIKKNYDVKLLSRYIRKLEHIVNNKTVLLTKTIIGKEELDVSAKKI